jgi:hypothetical protein
MADRTIPAHPVRDPDCDLWKTRPGHVCRRRDGLLLTGTNGDCHAHAVEHARRVRHMLDELAVAGYPHPDDDLTTVLAFLEEHPAGRPAETVDEVMARRDPLFRRSEYVDPCETDVPVCGDPDPEGQVWDRAVVACNLIAGHRNPNHEAWNAAGRRVAQWATVEKDVTR